MVTEIRRNKGPAKVSPRTKKPPLGWVSEEGEDPMKESTLAKITASVAAAKGMAQKALASSPNPEWTESEMQSIDEWIALQDVKLDRPEAIRRLVELGLKAKAKWRSTTQRGRDDFSFDWGFNYRRRRRNLLLGHRQVRHRRSTSKSA
jgi:hypothetical protein